MKILGMKKFLQGWQINIPKEYEKEFERECMKDNYVKIYPVSVLLFFVEVILLYVENRMFHSGSIILVFLISNLFFVPAIQYVHKRRNSLKIGVMRFVLEIYLLSVLVFGSALALSGQGFTDLVHTYFMCLAGICAFLYMGKIERTLLIVPIYLLFAVLIPYFQPDPSVVFVIRINSLIFNIISWLINQMLQNMKINAFLNTIQLREKNSDLENLVRRDSMTGLFNHDASIHKLKEELLKADSMDFLLSLIIADIDNFKLINDNFGHLTGDEVIRKVAHIIKDSVESQDSVGRYGGEEFILILPGKDLKGAVSLVEGIREAMRTADYGHNITVSLSGGITQYHGEDPEELIRQTDKKLYRAKALGKDRFEIQ